MGKKPQQSSLIHYLPILGWLPKYDRSWLTVDIVAGLTLWGLVVPQAMAYAGIAGLPPQAGLYTLLASLLGCNAVQSILRFVVALNHFHCLVRASVV